MERKAALLQGSVHSHVSWWEGIAISSSRNQKSPRPSHTVSHGSPHPPSRRTWHQSPISGLHAITGASVGRAAGGVAEAARRAVKEERRQRAKEKAGGSGGFLRASLGFGVSVFWGFPKFSGQFLGFSAFFGGFLGFPAVVWCFRVSGGGVPFLLLFFAFWVVVWCFGVWGGRWRQWGGARFGGGRVLGWNCSGKMFIPPERLRYLPMPSFHSEVC